MRLSIDKKNRRVIASGSYKGKKVKAIAVCSAEDEFDENIGRQIATLKYQVKEQEAKKAIHASNIKTLVEHIRWASKILEDETRIVDNMTKKIKELNEANNEKINNIVNKYCE